MHKRPHGRNALVEGDPLAEDRKIRAFRMCAGGYGSGRGESSGVGGRRGLDG